MDTTQNKKLRFLEEVGEEDIPLGGQVTLEFTYGTAPRYPVGGRGKKVREAIFQSAPEEATGYRVLDQREDPSEYPMTNLAHITVQYYRRK